MKLTPAAHATRRRTAHQAVLQLSVMTFPGPPRLAAVHSWHELLVRRQKNGREHGRLKTFNFFCTFITLLSDVHSTA